jgi:hypothetical protein
LAKVKPLKSALLPTLAHRVRLPPTRKLLVGPLTLNSLMPSGITTRIFLCPMTFEDWLVEASPRDYEKTFLS